MYRLMVVRKYGGMRRAVGLGDCMVLGTGKGTEANGLIENENGAAKIEDAVSRKVYADELESKSVENPRVQKWIRGSQKFFENLTWLTSNEAAEYLRLPSVGALRVLVCKRRVPFHKLGRSLRFKRVELDRLLEASKFGGL